jgi:aminopeptidase N
MQEPPTTGRRTEDRGSRWRLYFGVAVMLAALCLAVALIAVAWLALDRPGAAELALGVPEPTAAPADLQPGELSLPDTPEPMTPQAGGRSIGDPYVPELGNTGYDVQHYTLRLALDPARNYVEGTTVIEAVSQLHGLSELSLDLAGLEVTNVTVDGKTAAYAIEDRKLVIELPELLPVEAAFEMAVVYRGQPAVEQSPHLLFVDHLGLHYPDGESLFTIAEPDGARYWFPNNDHPRDKATFRFEVVVPAGLTAVANGRLLETRAAALPDNRSGELFIWEHNFPMATYLALVAVGDYERLPGGSVDHVLLRHYTFPELRPEVERAAAEIPEALRWMSDMFAPYPFEAFGFVTARVPGASMETQTMVLLSDGMVGPRTAVHELAHMWFGNWVSLDSWGEMWRNEGFATYVSLMWFNRDDREALELEIEGIRSAVEGHNQDYPLNNPPSGKLFEFNVYYKGALAVHALREEMGDEAFLTGLRTYMARYGGRTASDAQFKDVMEEAAGRSLEAYFQQWFPG